MQPQTPEGKLATIGYAIIGIPLLLGYCAIVGSFFARMLRYVYKKCCYCKNVDDTDQDKASRRCVHLEQQAITRNHENHVAMNWTAQSATLPAKHVHCNHHNACNNVSLHTCSNHTQWAG